MLDVGDRHQKNHIYLKRSLDSLQDKKILIKEEDREIHSNFISDFIWYTKKPYFDVFVSPILKPYLIQLKERFTLYSFMNISHLRSSFSIRVYQLLKSYEKIGKRSFDVTDLKYKLKIEDKYPNFADFKKRVLLPSQSEMKKKSDIYFTFTEDKKGRKVERINFFIKKNQKIKEEVQKRLEQYSNGRKISFDKLRIDNELFYILLSDIGMVPRLIQKIVDTYEYEYVKWVVNKVKVMKTEGKVQNVGAYVKQSLDESWFTNEYNISINRKKKENRAKIDRDIENQNKNKIKVIYSKWLKHQSSKDSEVIEDITNRLYYDEFIEQNMGKVLQRKHIEKIDDEGTLGFIMYKSFILRRKYGEEMISFPHWFFKEYNRRIEKDWDDDKWTLVRTSQSESLF